VWLPDHVLVRAARTGLLGLAAAVLAAVAHSSAGGTPPSPEAVLGVALLAALACWRASRRRMGPVRCALVSAAVQSALHLTFVAGAPASPGHSGLAMFAGHVVAGAAFGVWLAVGDAALWRAARRLAAVTAAAVRTLAVLASLLLADGGRRAPLRLTRLAAHRPLLPVPRPVLRHAVVRRGPPALALAAV
jgi:MYXO-CTERM domain-containing protein